MNAEELFAIMQSRRSIRRYQDRPVPDEIIHRCAGGDLGTLSAQPAPWRFAVIVDPVRRASLARAWRQFSH